MHFRLTIHLITENVSVKGWQKRYGKAISAKSPGFVQSELIRKAEKAGGSVQCPKSRAVRESPE